CFAIHGRIQSDQPLYRGTLRMIAVRDGFPAGFRSRAEYESVRAKLAHADTTPDRQAPPVHEARSIALGRTAWIEIPVPPGATVTGSLPFGGGLSFESPSEVAAPDGHARFLVRADRPHEVNLGRPWELRFSTGAETVTVSIHVADPNPGRTFYLLTEDCETFDGGPLTGNYRGSEHLGNHNNFMDPEEYRVQMIAKPDRLNLIAERHGARWTHFYAATQRFGAEWAARQSRTGQ